jgi:glycosyltransferase involved in cell wall biosynthesis
MPLAVIEGMAAGCAVIGTRVPGIQEIIADRVNGLLVEPLDPVSLADALERALVEDELVERIASTARKDAMKKYSLYRMNSDYAALFRQLMLEASNARNSRR